MLLTRRQQLGLLCAPLGRVLTADPIFETIESIRSDITWTHSNARPPERWLPESVCSGCAFLGYDNDRWLDIFLVNTGLSDFYRPAKPTSNALYHNNRDGTFTDVTLKAGLTSAKLGEGVAVGDFACDGFPEIYLNRYGSNVLYKDNRDGTFTDVTEKARVIGSGWSTSADWFDYDNDGKLDLFVASFVEYSATTAMKCGDNGLKTRYYCIPRPFEGRPSLLYHNNGDGTFTEVCRQAGIGTVAGKSYGVVATDVDIDGLIDLWLGYDTVSNFLFANRGAGKFEEIALAAGVASAANGQAHSGMGADSADYDNDGYQDLFVANIDRERFSIYRNDGRGAFNDEAGPAGIGRAPHYLGGWSRKFFDYDNDGNVDLLLANGHPDDMIEKTVSNVTWAAPLLLFRNDGRNWASVSAQGGPAFSKNLPARGLAVGTSTATARRTYPSAITAPRPCSCATGTERETIGWACSCLVQWPIATP